MLLPNSLLCEHLTFALTYYEVLGVSQSADGIVLRKAFHSLSKELHPDTTSLPVDQAAIKFQKLCEAYEFLSNPILRKAYDKSLVQASLATKLKREKTSILTKTSPHMKGLDVRRSLSDGELFSLFLLVISILVSLFLALVFAFSNGRELYSTPSWLISCYQLSTLLETIF